MSSQESKVSAILNAVRQKTIQFSDVICFIDDFYRFTPVSFVNGEQHNEVGENEGSAKVFGLAKLHHLSQTDTLSLFAEHYDAVLKTPNGTDHANIRNFMHWGWQGFLMEQNPLTARPIVDTE